MFFKKKHFIFAHIDALNLPSCPSYLEKRNVPVLRDVLAFSVKEWPVVWEQKYSKVHSSVQQGSVLYSALQFTRASISPA